MIRSSRTRFSALQTVSRLKGGVVSLALGLTLTLSLAGMTQVAHSQQQRPAPIERRAPSAPSLPPQQPQQQQQQQRAGGFRVPNASGQPQHLAQWMDSHRSLPLEQQQRALAAEPGFRQLRPEEQSRIQGRLQQLNTMSPDQRQRALARTEAMERLSPPQRVQVRSALKDLGALPEDRRRAVARTFRGLRDLPQGQQQAFLNGPQARAQFSDQERSTLSGLVNAAPYLPAPAQPQPRFGQPQ